MIAGGFNRLRMQTASVDCFDIERIAYRILLDFMNYFEESNQIAWSVPILRHG